MAQARLDESPPARVPVPRRSALRRELCQFGRDGRSTSQRSVLRCLFQRFGNLRVDGLRPEREVSRPLLRVDDDSPQPCVNLPPPLRTDRGDDPGRD